MIMLSKSRFKNPALIFVIFISICLIIYINLSLMFSGSDVLGKNSNIKRIDLTDINSFDVKMRYIIPVIKYNGLQIDVGKKIKSRYVEFVLDTNAKYKFSYLSGKTEIDSVVIDTSKIAGLDFFINFAEVPEKAVRQGYDKLIIYPLSMNKTCGISYINFFDEISEETENRIPFRLGDIFDIYKDYTILITAKEDAVSSLTYYSTNVMKKYGSRISDLGYGGSYAGIFYDGKFVAESINNDGAAEIDYLNKLPVDIKITSAGLNFGDTSSILINNLIELSQNVRGINIAVLDNEMEVITTLGFDTSTYDFFPRDLLKLKDSRIDYYNECIEKFQQKYTLSDILDLYSDNIILLSVKDEATNGLSASSCQRLMDAGSSIDNLEFRGAYVAVMNKDKIVIEDMNNDGMSYIDLTKDESINGLKVKKDLYLASAGYEVGNYSNIMIDGVEYSKSGRGINLVILKDDFTVINYFCIDTHANDEISGYGLNIFNLKEPITVADILEQYKDNILLLSVSDDATNSLSTDSYEMLQGMGSSINKLQFRGSFCAVISKGKLVTEMFNNNKQVGLHLYEGFTLDGLDIKRNLSLVSSGYLSGSYSSIKVNGVEHSKGMRGFNIVVLNDDFDVINSFNIDTYVNDAISGYDLGLYAQQYNTMPGYSQKSKTTYEDAIGLISYFEGYEDGIIKLLVQNISDQYDIEALYACDYVTGDKYGIDSVIPKESIGDAKVLLDIDAKRFDINNITKLRLYYKYVGGTQLNYITVFPFAFDNSKIAENDFMRIKSNVELFSFIIIDEENKIISFAEKETVINESLKIPRGYTFVLQPGSSVVLENEASIVSYSNFELIGSEDEPIRFLSNGSLNGGGITVISPSRTSVLEHVIFDGLGDPTEGVWNLTGAVTFYENEVEISNCKFINNRCEDGLNIIRSNFYIKNSEMGNTFSDAFDADFCTGVIEDCLFYNTGNDAVDVSTSIFTIRNTTILNPGDKGISGGEHSKVTAENIFIQSAHIGVGSKDLSEVTLKDVVIDTASIGFALYQKKPEFGPGIIYAESLTLKGQIKLDYLIESGSEVYIDGQKVNPKSRKKEKELIKKILNEEKIY